MNAETAYLFRHAVLRDAVYQLMLPGVRAALHALVVDVADAVEGLRIPAREVALHARAAQEDADETTVAALRLREAVWLGKAIDESLRRADLETARELRERTLVLSRGTERELPAILDLAHASRETGHIGRVEELLHEAETLPRDEESDLQLKGNLVGLYIRTGRLAEAERIQQEILVKRQGVGDEEGVTDGLGHLAVTHYHMGKFKEAEREYRQARRLAARLGKVSHLARYTANLALLLGDLDRVGEAEAMHREALRLAEIASDHLVLGNILGNFALLLTDDHRLDEAEPIYLRAMELQLRNGHRPGYAVNLGNMGRLQRMRGNYEDAQRLFNQAIELHMEFGAERHAGVMLGQLADLQFNLGEFALAEANLDRGLELVRHAQDRLYTGVMLAFRAKFRLDFADIECARSDLIESEELLAESTYEIFRAQSLYPVKARLLAATENDLNSVIAKCEALHARTLAAHVDEEVQIGSLLEELLNARNENRKPALYFGRPAREIDAEGQAELAAYVRERVPKQLEVL